MTNVTEEPTTDENLLDYHLGAEANVKTFSYKTPGEFEGGKASIRLGQCGQVRGLVQVVREGGENNLHYHTRIDALWMVLKGRVRFYGPDDVVLGEFAQHEGILIPNGARYWFESAGDEELELLQVSAFNEPNPKNSGRTDVSAQKFAVGTSPRFQAKTTGN